MPSTINGTTGFGGNLTGNVTGNVTGTSSAVADGAVSAAKLDGAQTGAAPIYGCRAWVNFDGSSGSTVNGEFLCTMRASGNVGKVVRNATGQYTVHFVTSMPDENYCCNASCNAGNDSFSASRQFVMVKTRASGSVQVQVLNDNAANAGETANPPYFAVAIFR